MILRLTKEFDFQMAHTLSAYDGKCRNIHGHNYRLFVTGEGEPIDDAGNAKHGMVMDFSDIKRLTEQCIIEPFDHAFVVPEGSPFDHIEGTKLVVVPYQPTCENLLMHFARLLAPQMPQGVRLHSLRLHETDSSCAELIL